MNRHFHRMQQNRNHSRRKEIHHWLSDRDLKREEEELSKAKDPPKKSPTADKEG